MIDKHLIYVDKQRVYDNIVEANLDLLVWKHPLAAKATHPSAKGHDWQDWYCADPETGLMAPLNQEEKYEDILMLVGDSNNNTLNNLDIAPEDLLIWGIHLKSERLFAEDAKKRLDSTAAFYNHRRYWMEMPSMRER